MKKIFQDLGDFKQSEARPSIPYLNVSRPRRSSWEHYLFLFVFLQEEFIQEALLTHTAVEFLETVVSHKLGQVHPIVHKQANKIRFVIDQSIHHDLLKVFCLQGKKNTYIK